MGIFLQSVNYLGLREEKGMERYANHPYDTLKMYVHAHGAKSSNLVINLGGDDSLIMDDLTKTLGDYGVQNETELSYFGREEYEKYKLDPVTKW
jgi:hypothetical protein